MFLGGKGTRIISAQGCRFAVCICFDQIARTSYSEALEEFEVAHKSIYPDQVDFLVVPQLNDEPNHTLFIDATRRFYERRPHLHRKTSIVCANVAAKTIVNAGTRKIGNSNFYLPFKDIVDYPLISCSEEVDTSDRFGGERLRLPKPIKRILLSEEGEWLLFLEVAKASTVQLEKAGDYVRSLLVRAWKWRSNDVSYSGLWATPTNLEQEIGRATNYLRKVVLSMSRSPNRSGSELWAWSLDNKKILEKDSDTKALFHFAQALHSYWTGDWKNAKNLLVNVAPQLKNSEKIIAHAYATWADVQLGQYDEIHIKNCDLLLNYREYQSSDGNIILSIEELALSTMVARIIGGVGLKKTLFSVFRRLSTSPVFQARTHAIEGFALWHSARPLEAITCFRKAVDCIKKSGVKIDSSFEEVIRWWQLCVYRLERHQDDVGWFAVFQSQGPKNISDETLRKIAGGDISRAEARAYKALQNEALKDDFWSSVVLISHLGFINGIFPVVEHTRELILIEAINSKNIRGVFWGVLEAPSLPEKIRERIYDLLREMDPDDVTTQNTIQEIAERLLKNSSSNEVIVGALNALKILLPYLSDEEFREAAQIVTNIRDMRSPNLNEPIDVRRKSFEVLEAMVSYKFGAKLPHMIEEFFNLLKRLLDVPETSSKKDKFTQNVFTDVRKSHAETSMKIDDYRDPWFFNRILFDDNYFCMLTTITNYNSA